MSKAKNMNLVDYKECGKEEWPTIYYIVGHQSSISQFKIHINSLVRAKFRVLAYEYDPMIIEAGEPGRINSVLQELIRLIEDDMSTHKLAGIYGISLGSFLGFNILARTNIKKAIFNTGPANLVEVVWHTKVFENAKKQMINNGYSKQKLREAWHEFDMPSIASRLTGARILCMNSLDDEVITRQEYKKSMKALFAQDVEVEEIFVKKLGHIKTVIRNLLRVKRTIKFYK